MSSQQQGQGGEAEKNIEIWKVKKLIKRLESARGNGTSMISLIIRMFLLPVNAYIGDPFRYNETTSPLTILYSPQGSDLARCEDVGGRIRMPFPSLVQFPGPPPPLARKFRKFNIWYRVLPPTSSLVSIVFPSFPRLPPPSSVSSCTTRSLPMAWSSTVVKLSLRKERSARSTLISSPLSPSTLRSTCVTTSSTLRL